MTYQLNTSETKSRLSDKNKWPGKSGKCDPYNGFGTARRRVYKRR